MATMQNADVTITLSNSEFAAINSLLFEVSRVPAEDIVNNFVSIGIPMSIPHAEILSGMWGDIHDLGDE